MEYFFLGLGNPAGYEGTRHNIGKDFIEGIVSQSGCPWHTIGNSRVACILIAEHMITCAVNGGYMNETGESMRELLGEINPSRLVVVHDEINFPIGTVRLSKNKSAGGHNGVDSIIQTLGTKEFFRLRVGIGQQDDTKNYDRKEYVLARVPVNEMQIITTALHESLPDIFSQLFGSPVAVHNEKKGIHRISSARCKI